MINLNVNQDDAAKKTHEKFIKLLQEIAAEQNLSAKDFLVNNLLMLLKPYAGPKWLPESEAVTKQKVELKKSEQAALEQAFNSLSESDKQLLMKAASGESSAFVKLDSWYQPKKGLFI